jgi:hypothetical protein
MFFFITRIEYGCLKNPPVKGTENGIEQKTGVFLSNSCPRVTTLGIYMARDMVNVGKVGT